MIRILLSLAALALAGCDRRARSTFARTTGRAAARRPPRIPAAIVWSTVAPDLSWTQVDPQFDEPPVRLLWTVLRFDLARWSLRAERSPDDSVTGLASAPGLVAAINGGYFEPDHSPSGVLVSAGQTLGRYAPRGGSGVLTLRQGRASVEASAGFPEDFTGDLAVQCGPRLVEEGGVVGVHRDDGRRAARTVACVRDGGGTLDVVLVWDLDEPRNGPGLQWLARHLTGPSPTGDRAGCERALNLDGGPSTGFHLAGSPGHAPVGPTPWLLTARAR